MFLNTKFTLYKPRDLLKADKVKMIMLNEMYDMNRKPGGSK